MAGVGVISTLCQAVIAHIWLQAEWDFWFRAKKERVGGKEKREDEAGLISPLSELKWMNKKYNYS